ncbi:MAG: response regulator [Lachnospiraceae bacterium]|nr:response regulator [Lachnospiraceae bacterium]
MKKTIFVVEDVEINREILCNIFDEKYRIIQASDGKEAIDFLKAGLKPNIMLLDIIMPRIDGFGVHEFMANNGFKDKFPVVVLTGENVNNHTKKAYDMGVNDVIEKPFDAYIINRRIENLMDLYEHKNNLERLVDAQISKIKRQAEKLNDINYRIIDTLGTIVEFRNLESGTHIFRVREYTKILLQAFAKEDPSLDLTEDKINMIAYASALHDIGKIGIPDNILLKPEKLTDAEFEVMKKHTILGEQIVRNISGIVDKQYIKYSTRIARSHHERYDGNGYPDGLKGDKIPFEAQVVSLADVYDALTNERVYKIAFTKDEAYRMILNGECGCFNPKILSIFEKVRHKLDDVVG